MNVTDQMNTLFDVYESCTPEIVDLQRKTVKKLANDSIKMTEHISQLESHIETLREIQRQQLETFSKTASMMVSSRYPSLDFSESFDCLKETIQEKINAIDQIETPFNAEPAFPIEKINDLRTNLSDQMFASPKDFSKTNQPVSAETTRPGARIKLLNGSSRQFPVKSTRTQELRSKTISLKSNTSSNIPQEAISKIETEKATNSWILSLRSTDMGENNIHNSVRPD